MALRDMTNEEMLAVTILWVNRQHNAYWVLSSRPITAAILAEVEAAHNDVYRLGTPEISPLDILKQKQGGSDIHHDELFRGVVYRLESEEQLAKTAEAAERFRNLRFIVAPEGMATIKKSYRHESGHAQIVESRLTDEHRAIFTSLRTADGTLWDSMLAYFAVGRELGELDHQRRMLESTPGESRNGDNMRARNRWIRAVQMMQLAASTLGPEDVEVAALMLAVDRATEQAALRRARARAEASGEDSDAEPDDTDSTGADSSDGADVPSDGDIIDSDIDAGGSDLDEGDSDVDDNADAPVGTRSAIARLRRSARAR